MLLDVFIHKTYKISDEILSEYKEKVPYAERTAYGLFEYFEENCPTKEYEEEIDEVFVDEYLKLLKDDN